VPSKKRKVDDGSDDKEVKESNQDFEAGSSRTSQASTSSLSPEAANQRSYITHDLINILLGTIDSLVRGISPSSGEEAEMPSEPPKPAPDSPKSDEKALEEGADNPPVSQ